MSDVDGSNYTAVTFDDCWRLSGPFFHGTRVALQIGDELVPGHVSNFHPGRVPEVRVRLPGVGAVGVGWAGVAYVTPIGSAAAQVEYRLTAHHGCGTAEGAEARFSYHADGSERPLVWTGRGLAEVGIVAGSVLDEGQFDAARALMAGLDPRTGERLVEPKLAVFEDAKVAVAPLVHAVEEAAAGRGRLRRCCSPR